jgi:hypothetical protein
MRHGLNLMKLLPVGTTAPPLFFVFFIVLLPYPTGSLPDQVEK